MNMSDVQSLLAQGFTPEFIMRLDNSDNVPVTHENPPEETNSETVPAPAEPAETPQNAEHVPVSKSVPPAAPGTELDRLFSELRNLTNAIQAGNRMSAEMGANIIDPQTAGREALTALAGIPNK